MGYRKQYAALPFVFVGTELKVCLISSRGTRRWIIPKGWPQKSLKPHELAAREAYEEAGLEGRVGRRPLGHFHYRKRLDDGSEVACDVTVFPLRVDVQALEWPEKSQRDGRWVGCGEAAELVDDAELGDLLRRFDPKQLHVSKAG